MSHETAAKGKGKRGGARIIYVGGDPCRVYLMQCDAENVTTDLTPGERIETVDSSLEGGVLEMRKKTGAQLSSFGADLIEGMKLVLAHRRGKIEPRAGAAETC